LISVSQSDDGTEKFKVHKAGLEYLRALPDTVAVISSCGKTKSGKTTLLNYLLCKLKADGFDGGLD
jgi:Flp pilus assembly CpaF family ATPase